MEIKKFGKKFITKTWNGEKLDSTMMAIDTETSLITSPAIIPDLVLITAYDGGDYIYIIKNKVFIQFMEVNLDTTCLFWNAAFDIPVLEQTGFSFDSRIMKNRVLDGQILYRLLSIAMQGKEANKWSLDYVTETILKEVLDKDESIRLTFGQYLNEDKSVRYSDISEAHIKYACLDPVATYLCTQKILKQIATLPTTTNLAHNINLLGDLALAKVTRNGIHIDQERVTRIKQELELEKVRNEEILSTYGYIKGKKGNTKVLEEICQKEGFNLPATETGKMCTAKVYLEDYKGHPFIEAYLQFKGFSKQQNFLNDLEVPIVYPRYNTIKVTSRTSCTKPNIQQMPRLGDIRGCFIPTPGSVFLDIDYSAIELSALASINLKLFKNSVMADLINEDKDLHKYAASKIYKVAEDDVSKEQRQTAKILNFGLVANMSPDTFCGHAAKFGLTLTIEESTFLKSEWVKVFPEMAQYWKRGFGKTIVVTDTGFIRGDCSYTEFLNCPMQLKCAEGAKIALYNIIKSGYKVVAFIHDQVIIEHPLEGSGCALRHCQEIMVDSMSQVIRGVKVSTTGEICDRFKK